MATEPQAPAVADRGRREEAEEGARRWLRLDLEYDGTEFRGWQRQAGGRTVQGEVEAALARVLDRPHAVVGAGRTDAGAHARGMVASLRTPSPMPVRTLARALDAVLPPDVGLRAASEAPPGFHARRDARWKWYRYTLLRSRRKRPLLRRTTVRIGWRPDLGALREGAEAFCGRHDFRSLANVRSPRRSTVRTLYAARWSEEGDLLHLDLVGDGFLYKMVRTLAGTLLERARGGPRASPAPPGPGGIAAAVARILGARDRAAAGRALPARGLCLMAVGMAGEAPGRRLSDVLARDVESVSANHESRGGRP